MVAQTTSERIGDLAEHTDTQRSLHQASAALDAAYRRIRQVRHSLLELSDRLPNASPNPDAQTRLLDDVGPGHEAIMLTGGLVEEPIEAGAQADSERPQSSRRVSIIDRLLQHDPRMERPLSGGDHVSEWRPIYNDADNPPPHSTALHSPVSPIRSSIPPRRSLLETQLSRRREALLDDPNTALGRRIAAREAARDTSREAAVHPQPNDIQQLVSVIDGDMQRFRIAARLRRSEPPPTEASDRLGDPELRSNRSLDYETLRRATQNPTSFRRFRPARVEPRQFSVQSSASHPSDRLSLLSNLSSVQNLATPTSSVLSRPLLFDEPVSYFQAADFSRRDSEARDVLGGDAVEDRSYIIRRMIDEDGEELIYNVRIPDDPGMMAADYALPPRPPRAPLRSNGATHQRNNTIQTSRTMPPPNVPRRRGWGASDSFAVAHTGADTSFIARLDADGNEIPSDEEEELERNRAEYRVMALYRAQAEADGLDPSGFSLPPRPRPVNLVPVTASIPSPSDDIDFADPFPRVRLSSRDPRSHPGSVWDSIATVDGNPSHRSQSALSPHDMEPMYNSGYPSPFYADPLPMPLSEMVPPARKMRQGERLAAPVKVPLHASLAGR